MLGRQVSEIGGHLEFRLSLSVEAEEVFFLPDRVPGCGARAGVDGPTDPPSPCLFPASRFSVRYQGQDRSDVHN